jgi:phosphatidylglycerophosphatase A
MVLGAIAFLLCVWICTQAVRQLNDPDPSAVILDEVWGMAAVFCAPYMGGPWPHMLLAFLLFRAFDTIKPFPLRWLECLPEGWGVMADDLGATLYTILVLKFLTRLMN